MLLESINWIYHIGVERNHVKELMAITIKRVSFRKGNNRKVEVTMSEAVKKKNTMYYINSIIT